MADWPVVRLGEHVDLDVGFAFKSEEFTDDPHDIRLVRGANIGQGTLKWDQERRFPGRRYAEFDKYHLRAGDVVLAMDRPWIAAGLKWAVVSKDDVPALLVQRVARLRGTATLAHEFLRYVIGSPEFEAYVQPIVTGVNVPHISASQIEDFRFHLPPVQTQRDIARLLGGLDDLIENSRRRIQILEEMARLVYREWFVHFRFAGYEEVELVSSDLGAIPRGWTVVPLESVAEVRRGLSWDREQESAEGVGVLTIPNIGDELDPVPRKHLTDVSIRDSERFAARSADTLMIGSNGNPERVGQSVWVGDNSGCVFASFLMRIRARDDMDPYLLFRHVSQGRLLQDLQSGAVGSTGLRNLRVTAVRQAPLLRASPEVEEAFARSTRPMRQLQDALLQMNGVLSEVRDLLLPRLISGELGASDLDLKFEPVA